MKTKLLNNPIGCIKTQKSALETVRSLRETWHDQTDSGQSTRTFQLAMFTGMMALLDESKTKVDDDDFRYDD